MGHHLTSKGRFKSDKYEWCPEGYFALSFKDPMAWSAIEAYIAETEDEELAKDLFTALGNTRGGKQQ